VKIKKLKLKNSQPFGEKMSEKNRVFLTHTVGNCQAVAKEYKEFSVD